MCQQDYTISQKFHLSKKLASAELVNCNPTIRIFPSFFYNVRNGFCFIFCKLISTDSMLCTMKSSCHP